MSTAAHLVIGLLCGLVAGTGVVSCGTPSMDGCHQRMVEELGCCPICDPDCHGAVDAACADDEHDPPVADDEPLVDESSSTAVGSDDDRPAVQ